MSSAPARAPSPGKAAQGTRAEWESELAAQREGLVQVIEAAAAQGGPETSPAPGSANAFAAIVDSALEYDELILPPHTELGARPPPVAVQGTSGWVYHSTSLLCLRPHHWPRRLAINTVEHSAFDPLILLTIMANCSTMAWSSPLDPPGTAKADLLAVLEWVYLYIFTFELTMKIIAYGFVCHKHSYLRDPWCQLDFVVVSLAWLPILFPQFGNMSAIRSVRALRPLRALKRVPGMPVLVGSILQSLPALGNVAGLSGFFFLVRAPRELPNAGPADCVSHAGFSAPLHPVPCRGCLVLPLCSPLRVHGHVHVVPAAPQPPPVPCFRGVVDAAMRHSLPPSSLSLSLSLSLTCTGLRHCGHEPLFRRPPLPLCRPGRV